MIRRFLLVRHSDPSGVSGTGIVAQGVEFGDGAVALRWICAHPSTAAWGSVDDVRVIHGHSGRTVVRWIDPFERGDEG
ncbi:MAG: hypothetical protein ACRDO7_16970 [Nocardioidaceae bacterium]